MLRGRLIVRVGVLRGVIVQAGQYLECGKNSNIAADRTQSVSHGAGGASGDERVPRVGFGLPGVQVGGLAHR